MKSLSLQGVALGISFLSLCACEVQDDSIEVNIQSKKNKQEEKALTCEELLNAHEDFEGQEIELSAINWGTSASEDGEEILMSIADELLQGLQQAHVLVHFSKDQQEAIKGYDENDTISLKAKVGALEFGAVRLINPEVSPN